MDAKRVETFFDKGKETLPHFVPGLPSLKFALTIGLIVFILGSITALYDRHQTQKSDDVIERTRWLFILAITICVASVVTDFIRDKHYLFASVALNKQHYANVAWLKEYMKALRAS